MHFSGSFFRVYARFPQFASCARFRLWVSYLSRPETQPQVFSMESCVMSDHKFEFDFWGCKVSAQGVIGIVAAVSVVAMLLAFYRF